VKQCRRKNLPFAFVKIIPGDLIAFNTLYSLLRDTIWDLVMVQWKGRNM